jgi:hypothetical protein
MTGASEARVTLLPCPFCGGDAELTGYRAPEFWVRCPQYGCKASTEGFGSKDRAIAAWNTRQSATAPLDAQIAGLVERNDALALQADEWEGKYAIASDMILARDAQIAELTEALREAREAMNNALAHRYGDWSSVLAHTLAKIDALMKGQNGE